MNTDTLVLWLIFLEYAYYFWNIKLKKNVNGFRIENVQPHGVASHLLDLLPI